MCNKNCCCCGPMLIDRLSYERSTDVSVWNSDDNDDKFFILRNKDLTTKVEMYIKESLGKNNNSWLLRDEKDNQISFTGLEEVQRDGATLPNIYNYIVTGTLGDRWEGATKVSIDYRNPVRVIKIFK